MPILSFLLFVFVSHFTPGPNNILAMAFAHKYGLKKTVRFCLGVSLGFFVLMMLCSFFHLLLTSYMPAIQSYLTFFGVLYMWYLAYKMLTSIHTDDTSEAEAKHMLLTGVLLQFINPKGVLYGLSVVGTFLIPYVHSVAGLVWFSLFLGMAGFVSSFCWSLFGSVFQKFLQRNRRGFHIAMAVLLVASSILLLI
ncbi:lysine transporter LysE [Brevibacillus parabrevis]|uniref:LysE family transporter n=1 Tax=Brevibacillus parabrevis TaxID=54914 RepID=UPI0007ABEB9E|nr:LysE family transporter [Brevibacillus parabrevis]KZE52443.1 lysine transporter LysE [Brevibacillus parabrevis]